MTKEKWHNVYNEEVEKLNSESNYPTPESWTTDRNILVNFIKEIDKATETFNMENKK